MKAGTLALFSGLAGVACASPPTGASAPPRTPDAVPIAAPAAAPEEAEARTLIDELAKGDWAHPRTAFDDAMSRAMPDARLREVWETLQAAGGPFRSIDETRVEIRDGESIVEAWCRFERLRKILRLAFDRDGKLAGLHYGPVPADLEAKTRNLLTAASRGDFDAASVDFGQVMNQALPTAKFAGTWKALEDKVGHWQSIESLELKPEHGVWTMVATSRFERDRLLVKVVYDVRNQVAGLFFLPVPVGWTAPPYARPDAFEERQTSVGERPALPGVLTIPRGSGPFPAVVLVHGSGPSDEDESVGGVKVFKDLAWGLASRGVAVLRYVKRSRQAPDGIVTQKEEVLDAAHDAIELLRHTPEVDARRISVVGHSQGGGLAPRIAKDNPGLAGIVVLAGPTRPLEDSLLEQLTYLASLAPQDPELPAQILAAQRFQKIVEDPALRADQDVTLPTGGSVKGAYFLDMRGYRPASVARSLPCRILVLQGERDYQVTMADFAVWKTAMSGRKDAMLTTYPSLNHLFVPGAGPPGPAEYTRPGHVDAKVVEDIARWILADGL